MGDPGELVRNAGGQRDVGGRMACEGVSPGVDVGLLRQEELLFRGLFLQRYQNLFGNPGGNLLQATVFAIAHAGVSYTPIGFVFLFVVAFPLGLVSGYLMRTTRGLLAPVIFHAGLDIPIYLGFLSYQAKC
jgi:membrane protease YdiL (CAAX protease family)